MLTEEEYYLAMREYEQWLDEQEQSEMAYATPNQEEQNDG